MRGELLQNVLVDTQHKETHFFAKITLPQTVKLIPSRIFSSSYLWCTVSADPKKIWFRAEENPSENPVSVSTHGVFLVEFEAYHKGGRAMYDILRTISGQYQGNKQIIEFR